MVATCFARNQPLRLPIPRRNRWYNSRIARSSFWAARKVQIHIWKFPYHREKYIWLRSGVKSFLRKRSNGYLIVRKWAKVDYCNGECCIIGKKIDESRNCSRLTSSVISGGDLAAIAACTNGERASVARELGRKVATIMIIIEL